MFKMLENLTKAAVSVAVTPVTLAADVLAIPLDADGNKQPFNRTGAMLNNASECTKEALKPEK